MWRVGASSVAQAAVMSGARAIWTCRLARACLLMIMIGLDPLAPPLSAPRARVVSCVILEATREARSSRVILRARYAREALAAGCGPVWRSLIRDAQAGEAIPILCFTNDCATLLGGTPSPQGPWRVREDQSFTGFSRANVELNFLPFIRWTV